MISLLKDTTCNWKCLIHKNKPHYILGSNNLQWKEAWIQKKLTRLNDKQEMTFEKPS